MIRLSFAKTLLLLLCLLIGMQGNAFAKHLKSKSNHAKHTNHTHQEKSALHLQNNKHLGHLKQTSASKDCAGAGKCLLNAQPALGTEYSLLSFVVNSQTAPEQSHNSYSSVLHSPPKPPPKA